MRTTFKLCLGAKSGEREKEKGKTLNNHNHPRSQISDSDSSSFTYSRLTKPSVNKDKWWKMASNASKHHLYNRDMPPAEEWQIRDILTHPKTKKGLKVSKIRFYRELLVLFYKYLPQRPEKADAWQEGFHQAKLILIQCWQREIMNGIRFGGCLGPVWQVDPVNF